MRDFILMSLSTILLSLYAGQGHSAGRSFGEVEVLGVNAFGQVLVKAGDRGEATPECSNDYDRFVADLNTEHGKAMYSLLLAAQAQGLKVNIGGQDNCNVRSNAETIQWVTLE